MTAQIRLIIILCDLYRIAASRAEGKTVSEKAVSVRVFNETAKIRLLREGRNLQTDVLQRTLEWFQWNWPVGQDRPPEILQALSSPTTWADTADLRLRLAEAESKAEVAA
jgi:hypothetical protein